MYNDNPETRAKIMSWRKVIIAENAEREGGNQSNQNFMKF